MLWSISSLLLIAPPSTVADAPAEPEIVEVVAVAPFEPPSLIEPEAQPPGPAPPDPELPEPEQSPATFAGPEPIRLAPPKLHFHWEVEVPLLVGAGAIWLGTELAVDRLVPAQPRWTEATAGDLGLRRALVWRSPATARHLSDAIAFGVIPLFGLTLTLADVGVSRQWRYVHEDLIIVLETVAVAAMLTQVIKLSAARGRPYTYEVYHDPPQGSVDQLLVYEPDAFLSFPSGHANLAFAFATSFATVATMRERKLAPYLWGFGMPLAGLVAYLRVAGHRHWFSDVVIGSTIGTVVGAGLPLLLHHPRFGVLSRLTVRKQRLRMSVAPTANGAAVFGQF